MDWNESPVALVTGGASGIGAASARSLAERGARVAVLDVDEPRGQAVADEIRGRFVRVDVGSTTDWERALGTIEEELGPVLLAHLNAGIMTCPPREEPGAGADLSRISEEAYRRLLGVNVDGVVFGIRALAPRMTLRGGGRIVVTASTGGLTAVPFDPLYSMTKHAMIGLVRSAAPWLAGSGVILSAVCPGGVDTPLVPDFVRSLSPPLLEPATVGAAVADLFETASSGGVFVVRPSHPTPEAVPEPILELS